MSTQTETPAQQTTGPSPSRPRRWLVAVTAALAAAVAIALAVAFGHVGSISCLLAGLVVAGWRRAYWPRRIAGLAAVLLAVASAGSVVNRAFVTYPTLDSLVRLDTTHFIDNAQLNAMRAQVAKTGQLPSHGITISVAIPATGSKFTPRPAYVWVPPAWFARNHPQLPVIELLHGSPGNPSDWIVGMGAPATALAFAEQHHGIAPILVMPDIKWSRSADTECVNSTKYGDVATYLAKTVPAFMQIEFNASTAPGSAAVAGLSEGGMCATTLALNNPKVFAAFGNYSGDASPTYLDDKTQQTIQILFGGSQASYNAYNPPFLRPMGVSPACPAGSRPEPRTPASCRPPACWRLWLRMPGSTPASRHLRVLTATSSGSRLSTIRCRGCPGSWSSRRSRSPFPPSASPGRASATWVAARQGWRDRAWSSDGR